MLQEVRSDHFVVHDDASIVGDRSHAPDKEDALEKPVEWNHLGNVEREELEDGEAGVDHPVSQPFGVVGLVSGLNSFHGNVSWIGDANDVAENLSGIAEGEVQCDESNKT